MNTEEKLAKLEEIFEMDAGELDAGAKLDDLIEWDSMAKLSLIALCDDDLEKILTGEQIREFKTVQDILDFMG